MRLAGIALLALASAAAACGQESNNRSSSHTEEPPVLTAADLGDQAALTVADCLATEPYASADRLFPWTPTALDAWLTEPARFLPGNRMSFVGVRDADDRADLIAYLLEATSRQ